MKVHYFSPFSISKDFLPELDYYMSLLPLPTDWACFFDGDTMFIRNEDYGNSILEYIERYPQTGMFTCYASRCHYSIQIPPFGNLNNDSLKFHRNVADQLNHEFQPTQQAEIIKQRVAGHLMLFRKSTWEKIRADVFQRVRAKNHKILGVDTQICYALFAAGLDIKLMKGIYVVHYLRLMQGIDNISHLE